MYAFYIFLHKAQWTNHSHLTFLHILLLYLNVFYVQIYSIYFSTLFSINVLTAMWQHNISQRKGRKCFCVWRATTPNTHLPPVVEGKGKNGEVCWCTWCGMWAPSISLMGGGLFMLIKPLAPPEVPGECVAVKHKTLLFFFWHPMHWNFLWKKSTTINSRALTTVEHPSWLFTLQGWWGQASLTIH